MGAHRANQLFLRGPDECLQTDDIGVGGRGRQGSRGKGVEARPVDEHLLRYPADDRVGGQLGRVRQIACDVQAEAVVRSVELGQEGFIYTTLCLELSQACVERRQTGLLYGELVPGAAKQPLPPEGAELRLRNRQLAVCGAELRRQKLSAASSLFLSRASISRLEDPHEEIGDALRQERIGV